MPHWAKAVNPNSHVATVSPSWTTKHTKDRASGFPIETQMTVLNGSHTKEVGTNTSFSLDPSLQ